MFVFTVAGDFMRKVAWKLSKDGNVAEEGNLPTKGQLCQVRRNHQGQWFCHGWQLCCFWLLQHGDKFANGSGVAKYRDSSKFAVGHKSAMECNWQQNQGL